MMDIKKLALIMKGTKRKKRTVNLLELSKLIYSIHEENKSLKKTANMLRLSPEMVRQFLKINSLDNRVKSLIKNGSINSVDIGYRLSKLDNIDQFFLAKKVVEQALSTDDVRSIIKYKVNNPDISIEEAINKVILSKDKNIFVAYLGIEADTFDKINSKYSSNVSKEKLIKTIFSHYLGSNSIVSSELNGRVVILKLYKEGSANLRKLSKDRKIPITAVAEILIREYIKRG